MDAEDRAGVPAGEPAARGPAVSATLTSSGTACAVWAVSHYVMGGEIPPELYGFLQTAAPAACGWLGACVTRLRQERSLRAARAAESPVHDSAPTGR